MRFGGLCVRPFCLAAAVALLSGCVSVYIDPQSAGMQPQQVRKIERAAPVQLVVNVLKQGAPAPSFPPVVAELYRVIKPEAIETVKRSGLFTEVTDGPSPNGAVLRITVNHVTVRPDAFARGELIAPTPGFAGATTTEAYLCTVSYQPPNGPVEVITKSAKHAMHITIDPSSVPRNAIKADYDDALRTVIRQSISVALDQLAADPAFKPTGPFGR